MMEAMVYDKGWKGYAWRCFCCMIACAYVSVRGLDGYDRLASNCFLGSGSHSSTKYSCILYISSLAKWNNVISL
jgi:hypothetical protein